MVSTCRKDYSFVASTTRGPQKSLLEAAKVGASFNVQNDAVILTAEGEPPMGNLPAVDQHALSAGRIRIRIIRYAIWRIALCASLAVAGNSPARTSCLFLLGGGSSLQPQKARCVEWIPFPSTTVKRRSPTGLGACITVVTKMDDVAECRNIVAQKEPGQGIPDLCPMEAVPKITWLYASLWIHMDRGERHRYQPRTRVAASQAPRNSPQDRQEVGHSVMKWWALHPVPHLLEGAESFVGSDSIVDTLHIPVVKDHMSAGGSGKFEFSALRFWALLCMGRKESEWKHLFVVTCLDDRDWRRAIIYRAAPLPKIALFEHIIVILNSRSQTNNLAAPNTARIETWKTKLAMGTSATNRSFRGFHFAGNPIFREQAPGSSRQGLSGNFAKINLKKPLFPVSWSLKKPHSDKGRHMGDLIFRPRLRRAAGAGDGQRPTGSSAFSVTFVISVNIGTDQVEEIQRAADLGGSFPGPIPDVATLLLIQHAEETDTTGPKGCSKESITFAAPEKFRRSQGRRSRDPGI
ncbi:hypothetical protein B0H16DRAFT_1769950 [Mycena metata]|uniref:Uncharacterized protein n=1 Tax=Mycena metata TaxID=1033252 RepID=A0AAD7I1G7_9AGAR|nr:hypothetical protein B0H16DRAFT_1769950 [Mycena metata]